MSQTGDRRLEKRLFLLSQIAREVQQLRPGRGPSVNTLGQVESACQGMKMQSQALLPPIVFSQPIIVRLNGSMETSGNYLRLYALHKKHSL